MNSLHRFNPARRMVGRLFLWFWVTFIVTALITVYAVRFFNDISLREPVEKELAALKRVTRVVERIVREDDKNLTVRQIIGHADRASRHLIFAVDIATGELIRQGGPPLPVSERETFREISMQEAPVAILRGGFSAIGPARVTINGRDVALYVGQPLGPPDGERPMMYFLIIALIMTIVLSYLFARTLVKPIHHLQDASRKLASGDWGARVGDTALRRDELGELSRDFNAMATQLERLWLGQQRLLADISHELRSPLARLQMAVGLAHQQNVDPTTLERIEREGVRMDVLIDQLLQLTRVEAGKADIKAWELPVLLDAVFTDAQFEAANLNKVLDITAIPPVTVNVNDTLICRAVENVLRNALRHATSQVSVSVTQQEQCWQVAINDDGPGLSEAECEAIFAPFYRASLARERESGGVGLGLAIAKAAVEMHHGDIHATRNASGGLQVTLRLPMDGKEQWPGQSPAKPT